MDLKDRIRYCFHFDELTWIPGVIESPFFYLQLPYSNRMKFMDWLSNNTIGDVYVWSGVISPNPGSTGWGSKICPHEENTFIVFTNESDQTRFSLEFVGNPDGICKEVFKNGMSAYYFRTR